MTSPLPDARAQAAVVSAYQQQTTQLRAQLAAYITAAWAALGSYRETQAAEFAALVAPVVEAAMAHMQSITQAYLATIAGLVGASTTPVVTPALGIAAVRNGADPAEVYARPFHLVWRQLAENQPLDGTKIAAAIQSGLDRAVQTAATDLQLAKTHTSLGVTVQTKHIVGWQRVLEGPYSCGLCAIASTVRYRTDQLMPIHPACDCSVLPIIGDEDPGRTINFDLLDSAHAAVQKQFGADSTAARQIRGAFTDRGKPVLYRDVLITHHHGELGPVMGIRGQRFTSPADLAA